MGNIPARACDPFLKRKVYELTQQETAAALVKLVSDTGRTYPSKTTLEQMYYDQRLFQERKVREVADILSSWGKSKPQFDPTRSVLFREICVFDHSIYGFDEWCRRIAKEMNVSRDEIIARIATNLGCRREFVHFFRTRTLVPRPFCLMVVREMQTLRLGEASENDIFAVESNEAGMDTPRDDRLRKMLISYLYPERKTEFVQRLSGAA